MVLENKNKFLTNEGFTLIVDSIKNKIATNVVTIEKIVVVEESFGIATCRDNKTGIRYQIIFEVNIKDGAKYLYTKKVLDK